MINDIRLVLMIIYIYQNFQKQTMILSILNSKYEEKTLFTNAHHVY